MRGTTPIVEASPYQVVAETIGAALDAFEGAVVEPIWLAALAAIVPELARRYPALPSLPELDPERDRRRLFEAISVALTRLAAARPLLVELEDLHWAGPATVGCSRTWPATWPATRSWSWRPTARRSSSAATRCATCAAGCCARGWWTGSRSAA